jgi:hypothetical protein
MVFCASTTWTVLSVEPLGEPDLDDEQAPLSGPDGAHERDDVLPAGFVGRRDGDRTDLPELLVGDPRQQRRGHPPVRDGRRDLRRLPAVRPDHVQCVHVVSQRRPLGDESLAHLLAGRPAPGLVLGDQAGDLSVLLVPLGDERRLALCDALELPLDVVGRLCADLLRRDEPDGTDHEREHHEYRDELRDQAPPEHRRHDSRDTTRHRSALRRPSRPHSLRLSPTCRRPRSVRRFAARPENATPVS